MKQGRRIAFDYGDVRIGIAMSDLSGMLASPFGVIATQSNVISEIAALIDEFDPIYFAVGIPKHLSGNSSAKMESVEKFIDALEENFAVRVIRIDERLSTVSAAKSLQASGKNAKESKALIDAAAAATILDMAMAQEKFAEGNHRE
jgi:putative Holliday junction resolvase